MKTYAISQKHQSVSTRKVRLRRAKPTPSAIVTDICLVAAWGATIPGLMWLGVMGGF